MLHEHLVGWIQLGIACIVFVGSTIFGVLRVSWTARGILEDIKADFNARMAAMNEDHEKKRARVYERFDEYKNFIESNYVRKDMCTMAHATNAQVMIEHTRRVESLEVKIDELKTILINALSKLNGGGNNGL